MEATAAIDSAFGLSHDSIMSSIKIACRRTFYPITLIPDLDPWTLTF